MNFHHQSLASSSEDLSLLSSMDPLLLISNLPYSVLRVPCMHLKVPSFSPHSSMTVFSLVLATYFFVVSGFLYNVIVKPPGFGSAQILSQEHKTSGLPLRKSERAIYYQRDLIRVYVLAWWGGNNFAGLAPGQTREDQGLFCGGRARIKVSFAVAGVSSLAIAFITKPHFLHDKDDEGKFQRVGEFSWDFSSHKMMNLDKIISDLGPEKRKSLMEKLQKDESGTNNSEKEGCSKKRKKTRTCK